MTNRILSLALVSSLILSSAALAQRGHGGERGGERGGYRGGERGSERGGYRGGERGSERGGRDHGRDERGHFDGRHFDGDYRGRYFGRGHLFLTGYIGGNRFYYGGFWWGFEAWPIAWSYGDYVYIEYDADADIYYLVDLYHPERLIIRITV